MSKLYKQYVLLKINNPNKFYLFKSGIFFIFIDEDAKEMSRVLNLKMSNLNSDIVKCGFPYNSLDKYMNILNSLNYNVEIITPQDNSVFNYNNYVVNSKIESLMNDIINTDIDKLSISQAYDFLYKIQNEINEFNNNRGV